MRQRNTVRRLYADLNDHSDNVQCAIHGCKRYPQAGMYVCFMHGIGIYQDFIDIMDLYASVMSKPTTDHTPRPDDYADVPPPQPEPNSYVYYLMLGPHTVKIGTTRKLITRLSQLRSELQYVVALERGGRDLERQRHLQFAAERISRREDFRITDRLQAHIEALTPQRDELVAEAAARQGIRIAPDQDEC